ncbi:polysaccharide pyruvyl transferase family protein [Pseudochrobactrum algeriensis]|uniref:polysaccharide pyruvyl transferase family protein n=1 Tax=Pseudochrobactrum algeriensis TaxID=2834768 RepID=UPI001BCA99B4|nr:polysaccharide pyruvyl transferase family protein [Pseudochrobactrum algeriensis]
MSDLLIDRLATLRNQHVFYFPNTGNGGDGFIAHATMWLLNSLSIEFTALGPHEIAPKGSTLLFGGGGNLIENQYDTLYNAIQSNIDGNTGIVLPHTIRDYRNLFSKDNLEIFIRDPISYDNARKYTVDTNQHFYLSHDMTFYLPKDYFQQFWQLGDGVFYCFRQDEERDSDLWVDGNQDISLSWNGSWWTNERLSKASTEAMAASLSPSRIVATDRLHVAILAAFLGKRVYMTANNYYKNEAIYRHSLSRFFPNTSFHKTRQDIVNAIKNKP